MEIVIRKMPLNSIIGDIILSIAKLEVNGGTRLTIHNWKARCLASFVVFLCVSLIVVPHLMDVHPPMLVNVLLWPMYLIGPAVGRMLPHGNIGTVEHPVYEGTPLDLLAGLSLAIFSILWYPVSTFIFLTLVSRVQLRRRRLENE